MRQGGNLPQTMPMPISAPRKFPIHEAKTKPSEQTNPPNMVIARQPILLTNAPDTGARSRGKLTNNEAIMPTVWSSSFRSSLIKCIRIPKENRTPSATKWTQNEPKTIIHRHDDVWRRTVFEEELSVLSDSSRCGRCSRPAQAKRNRSDVDVDTLDIGSAGADASSMVVSDDIVSLSGDTSHRWLNK